MTFDKKTWQREYMRKRRNGKASPLFTRVGLLEAALQAIADKASTRTGPIAQEIRSIALEALESKQ